jgi:hypothetical protein
LATGPFPPGFFAARFLAAVIRPPLLFFAILNTSLPSALQVGGRERSILPPMTPVKGRKRMAVITFWAVFYAAYAGTRLIRIDT